MGEGSVEFEGDHDGNCRLLTGFTPTPDSRLECPWLCLRVGVVDYALRFPCRVVNGIPLELSAGI